MLGYKQNYLSLIITFLLARLKDVKVSQFMIETGQTYFPKSVIDDYFEKIDL